MNLTIKQIEFVIETNLSAYLTAITVNRNIKDDASRFHDLKLHTDIANSKLDGIAMLPCIALGSKAFQLIQNAKCKMFG